MRGPRSVAVLGCGVLAGAVLVLTAAPASARTGVLGVSPGATAAAVSALRESVLPMAVLPSTTSLVASASTAEVGSPVELTATVAPVDAAGDVEFFDGTTSLGAVTIMDGVAGLSTSGLTVGTHTLTAVYSGGYGYGYSYGPSASAPVTVVVTAPAMRPTVTTLTVTPGVGAVDGLVALSATVTSPLGSPDGTVVFRSGTTVLGTVPVVAGSVATLVTNALVPTQGGLGCAPLGGHVLTAEFVGTAPYLGSVSGPVGLLPAPAWTCGDEQTVTVEVPVGTITITTPYTPASPLHLGVAVLDQADSTYSASAPFTDIVITDTRAGNLGFTASVVSGPFIGAAGSFPGRHAGLTDLVAVQVVGNALLASDVTVTDHAPFADGLGSAKEFASYPSDPLLGIGTAAMHGTFSVDQVPTSVGPGMYTATVTFTAV